MKNVIALFMFGLCFITGMNAQTPMTAVSATITNTGTAVLTATSTVVADNIAFQVNVTKVSGTVAGKCYLYGSLDGINYKRVGGLDSLTLTNIATNVALFNLTPNRYRYYQITTTGSGTMVATHAGYFLAR